jgi:putative glutamine amidotransferase
MIKIGVTAGLLPPDPRRKVYSSKKLNYIENDLARFLVREGVVPVLLPDLPLSKLRPLLHQMDGFVFQGVSDVAPQTYWEKPLNPQRWQGDPLRDLYELEIMEFAIKQHKPVLGISRGFHLMNVFFGGTLYQDIQIQRPGSITHLDETASEKWMHGIEICSGGLFEKFYSPQANCKVNSYHHQAVSEIGNELDVQARCKEDQIIEAFSWAGAEEGKVMGVQWHPELESATTAGQNSVLSPNPIYAHFLKLCFGTRRRL